MIRVYNTPIIESDHSTQPLKKGSEVELQFEERSLIDLLESDTTRNYLNLTSHSQEYLDKHSKEV